MKINNQMDMKGQMHLRMTNRSGEEVRKIVADNDIVRAGRELIADLFTSDTLIEKSWHLAVGRNGEEVRRDQVALGDEIAGGDGSGESGEQEIARIPIASFQKTFTDDGKVLLTLSATLDFDHPANDETLREAGLFTQSTGGKMYNRVTFDEVGKTSDFQLTIVWEIIF